MQNKAYRSPRYDHFVAELDRQVAARVSGRARRHIRGVRGDDAGLDVRLFGEVEAADAICGYQRNTAIDCSRAIGFAQIILVQDVNRRWRGTRSRLALPPAHESARTKPRKVSFHTSLFPSAMQASAMPVAQIRSAGGRHIHPQTSHTKKSPERPDQHRITNHRPNGPGG